MRTPKRLVGPMQLSNAAATVYTSPANTRTVIRHIHIYNADAATPRSFTMSIGADAAAARIFDAFTIGASTPIDFFCYFPLEPGEILQAFSGTNLILTLTIGGDQFKPAI